MADKGVGGFFIHGRFGLQTEYLSDDWMNCVERAVVTAEELGMEVWLYDEYPFPSGVAGGATMRSKSNHCRFLDVVSAEVSDGETAELAIPDGELVCAAAVSEERNAVTPISAKPERGVLRWTAPAGRWWAMAFTARIAESTVFIYGSEPNYFEPNLAAEFISLTHEAYAARFRQHFGKTIKGIFTDEPKMQCIYHLHDDGRTTVWFDDLEQAFRDDHGYDLVPNLPSLFADVGTDPGRVRRDFWNTAAKRYIERYFLPYREWCEENGLLFTGHLFIEEGLYSNTIYQGDFARVLSTMHVPGVDHLALVTDSEYVIPNYPPASTRVNGQKLVTSIAHAMGAERVLSETFGCAGWEMSAADMKWIVDWQYSLGVNFLCPHAFFYSAAGLRKADAPPSQFLQATFWPFYKQFADYAARLGYMLSQGTHRAQIGLLYPRAAFQSSWKPGFVDERTLAISTWFDFYCGELPRQHLDYDILTEDMIADAEVTNGKLRIGRETFELLILPPAPVIEERAARKIEQFSAAGGRVIRTDLDEPPITGEELRCRIADMIEPDLTVTSGDEECRDIHACVRNVDGGRVVFFANNAREQREVSISLKAQGAPFVCNLETGDVRPLPHFKQSGGHLEFDWCFPSGGSLLIFVDQDAASEPSRPTDLRATEITLDDVWAFDIEGFNIAPLTDWTFRAGPGREYFEYSYTAAFHAQAEFGRLWLVLDDLPDIGAAAGNVESECRVFINGASAADSRKEWWDVRVQTIDISEFARIGENSIEIRLKHSGWAGAPSLMVSPALIAGKFSILPDGTLAAPPTTMQTGSWTERGYPYFSGTGVYSQSFELTKEQARSSVFVECDYVSDFAEFIINGMSAGCRLWPPFSTDLTGFVRAGKNDLIIKVTNSAANRQMLEPRPSGLMGEVTISIRK